MGSRKPPPFDPKSAHLFRFNDRIDISYDLERLQPTQWFNDNIIQAYANIILDESLQESYRSSARHFIVVDSLIIGYITPKNGYKKVATFQSFQEVCAASSPSTSADRTRGFHSF
jgi:hypothetical protein